MTLRSFPTQTSLWVYDFSFCLSVWKSVSWYIFWKYDNKKMNRRHSFIPGFLILLVMQGHFQGFANSDLSSSSIIHATFSFPLSSASSPRRNWTNLLFSPTYIFLNFTIPLNTVPQHPNAHFPAEYGSIMEGSGVSIHWFNCSEMQIILIKIQYTLCFLLIYS